MRTACVANKYCEYKSSTGCSYAGPGCAQEPILTDEIVHSIGIVKDSPMVIVKQVELTDECIERIAKAVVEKLTHEQWKKGKWINYKDEHCCSICDQVIIEDCWDEENRYNYCPYCGADMEDEE